MIQTRNWPIIMTAVVSTWPLVAQEKKASSPKPASQARTVEIGRGTKVRVRLMDTLDSSRAKPGDRFEASLVSPVEVDGKMVLPKGTRFAGRVVAVEQPGRLRGGGRLVLGLESFRLNKYRYQIATSTSRSPWGWIRGTRTILATAGTGAVIGALAGGGVGAAIGAGSGAAAGAVTNFVLSRKPVRIPAESVLAFSLERYVRVRV